MEPEFGLLSDLVRVHARETPQRAAMIQDARQIDYRGLDLLVDRVASTLQHCGAGKGDVIAICSAASIEYGAVFLGALRAGIGVAPLPTSSRAESLEMMLADCAAKLVFVDAANAASFKGVPASAPLIALDDSGAAAALARWLLPAGSRPQAVPIEPPDTFNIIYSSGTTGAPKGIVQSHRMRWAHVQRLSATTARP
jgi:long-chain acyl-CoA synthetase